MPLACPSGAAIAAALCLTLSSQGQVRTPSEHLGRPLGTDFTLADWTEVSTYLRHLGDASPNAVTEKVGTTTEGRDFLITTISSPENLGDLPAIQRRARVLADPRDADEATREDAVANGRITLFVSCAMHASECAGAQHGLAFAHALATSDEEPWISARREIVTVLYITNPDGVDHVTNWYRETVGTPYEGANLLKLYQFYTGHDNNRDWFGLTQAETRIVTELLYTKWFPQVYWDVHQQGSGRERFFVPPFRDPLNPNLDPGIITGIDVLGSRALMDMTREGLTGISTGVSYDMWWNGGNRNVPVRHNIIGLLTEAASARLATPRFFARADLRAPSGLDGYVPSNRFPAPWPGGWWRVADIIEYAMSFGRSLLGSLAREPEFWRQNALHAADRTLARAEAGAPRAWLLPRDNVDPGAVRRLADLLLRTGVEVHVATAAFEADGRPWPEGTVVIQRRQPYGAHVKDLFEVQRYPDGAPPYDVAGWTLPLLLGVRRVAVMETIDPPVRQIEAAADVAVNGDPARRAAPNGVLSARHSDDWPRLVQSLAGGVSYALDADGLLRAGPAAPSDLGIDLPVPPRAETLPRIGVYAPWSASKSEGWLRWVLDTFTVPFARVRNEQLRAGALADAYDVIVIPDIAPSTLEGGRAPGSVPEPFARGLDPEGAIAVEEFVRGGGHLVTLGDSSRWAIELLRVPLVDVTREEKHAEFSCPGSVVRTVPEPHALAAGLPASLPVFFSRDGAWRPMTKEERTAAGLPETGAAPDVILRYAPTRVLMSGWIKKPQAIANRAAWVRTAHGAGTVDLFAFSPHYRGWSQAAFPALFRAMLFE